MTPKAAAVSEPTLPISPTPRPLKKTPPKDDIAEWNERMREACKPVYAELQAAGEVGIPLAGRPELLDQVGWMRARGVKVLAKMRPEGTHYVLVSPPAGENNEDALNARTSAKLLEGPKAVAPREEHVDEEAHDDGEGEQDGAAQ